MAVQFVTVPQWPSPKGYANGTFGSGRPLHVAGQIGWNADGQFEAVTLIDQFAVALDNVLAVLAAAGGEPSDIASMTVYVTEISAYRAALPQLGAVWKPRLGKHFPAMALVAVTALVEPAALIEISAVAYIAGA
jgi:enamine deaminase RidA (YjgF/YER057c/UK114 family)